MENDNGIEPYLVKYQLFIQLIAELVLQIYKLKNGILFDEIE